jgi:uncharacterized protein (TIRG00374 family)
VSKLSRNLGLAVAGGAALYVAFAAASGMRSVGARLHAFSPWAAVAALALAAANYLLRFGRWHYYLARLGLRVRPARSLGIFLSGFALTVTPGKLGELLKSYLLREEAGVPMARSAPIVLAERLTDLVGCLALAAVGISSLGSSRGMLGLTIAGAGLVAALLAAFAFRPLGEGAIALCGRLPLGARVAPKLGEFYRASRVLLAPAPLAIGACISLVAWAAECAAFFVVLRGFPGGSGGFVLCTFIYAAMTVAGALSFLPGGLLVQEGGMVGLLVAAGGALDEPTAFAATFVTRLCTLWFAVLLGAAALVVTRRRLGLDLAAVADRAAPLEGSQ